MSAQVTPCHATHSFSVQCHATPCRTTDRAVWCSAPLCVELCIGSVHVLPRHAAPRSELCGPVRPAAPAHRAALLQALYGRTATAAPLRPRPPPVLPPCRPARRSRCPLALLELPSLAAPSAGAPVAQLWGGIARGLCALGRWVEECMGAAGVGDSTVQGRVCVSGGACMRVSCSVLSRCMLDCFDEETELFKRQVVSDKR